MLSLSDLFQSYFEVACFIPLYMIRTLNIWHFSPDIEHVYQVALVVPSCMLSFVLMWFWLTKSKIMWFWFDAWWNTQSISKGCGSDHNETFRASGWGQITGPYVTRYILSSIHGVGESHDGRMPMWVFPAPIRVDCCGVLVKFPVPFSSSSSYSVLTCLQPFFSSSFWYVPLETEMS